MAVDIPQLPALRGGGAKEDRRQYRWFHILTARIAAQGILLPSIIKSACAINDGIKAALALRLGVEELKPLRMQFERGPFGFEKQAVTAPQATLPRALGLLG
jgi:hypothetical protein